ncbi:hypothetical protein PVAP13_J194701 [Panicum virgatum]|nr:hypothetical protein PVAP13_J194701 [Panicum virgatum]
MAAAFRSDDAKEVVHYQTVSPKGLAKSCSKEDAQKNVDVAIVFLGSKLQSSDISKDKQVDPTLADTLKLSFTSSEFSMAFPYVFTSDDEKLENSLLNRVTYTDTCTVIGQYLRKHRSMDSIRDLVTSRMGNNPSGQTDLVVFCSGGELLSELVAMLKKSGAKYTILYASQPSAGRAKCDGECLVKSTLLEGTFVGIVLLIILISGLMCMMGIDTPSRFEAPQES